MQLLLLVHYNQYTITDQSHKYNLDIKSIKYILQYDFKIKSKLSYLYMLNVFDETLFLQLRWLGNTRN